MPLMNSKNCVACTNCVGVDKPLIKFSMTDFYFLEKSRSKAYGKCLPPTMRRDVSRLRLRFVGEEVTG